MSLGTPAKLGEWTRALRELLTVRGRTTDLLLHALKNTDTGLVKKVPNLGAQKEIIDTVILMIHAAGVSCHSIVTLSSGTGMSVRDCFPIARSVVETAVNACFIQARGIEAARRAQRHALQKSYRDLNRGAKFGELQMTMSNSAKVDPSDVLGLQAAISEFSNKRGEELRDWTPESIDEKIEAAKAKYGARVGIDLGAARMMIYRHSSEILHGTYFGATYFWKPSILAGAARSTDEFASTLFDHFSSVFMGIFFALSGIFDVFDKEYEIPAVREANEAAFERLKQLPFVSDALKANDAKSLS
jgi:hypothetical protein